MDNKELFTVSEFAKKVGKDRNYIYNLIHRNRILSVEVKQPLGRAVIKKIPRSELKKFE